MSSQRTVLPSLAIAATSGLLFGAGLYVSQMIDPFKVLRFLDFGAIPTGGWDPSLAFVMVPAVLVMLIAVRFSRTRAAPFLGNRFVHPELLQVDAGLLGGSALFGVGWGMSGMCPGPALALLAFPPVDLWLFLAALIAGSLLGSFLMPRDRGSAMVPA